MKTGWPPGLLQDNDRRLSKWFASKPDARRLVRERCTEIENEHMNQRSELEPMTDRDLLKLAAKAAGIYSDLFFSPIHGCAFFTERYNSGSEYQADAAWNPLQDDGDALRLAVKLGLASSSGTQVYTADDDLMAAWADRDSLYGTDLHQQVQWSKSHGDPYAATRRAIVRAAAEIGKAVP